MSIEKVRAYFASVGLAERIQEFEVSSATVALAAEALPCTPRGAATACSGGSANTAGAVPRLPGGCWTRLLNEGGRVFIRKRGSNRALPLLPRWKGWVIGCADL